MQINNLRLMCFITHQYRQLEDLLVETLLVAVKTATNEADKLAKDEYYQNRNEQAQHTQQLVHDTKSLMTVISELQETFENALLADSEKVKIAMVILPKQVCRPLKLQITLTMYKLILIR